MGAERVRESAIDPDHIAELFFGFGPVTVRRMFSGAGIFADGLMIALVVDGVIFLKADAATAPRFESEGQTPFSYERKEGRRTIMSYWRMPERLYDDPDELAEWARLSMVVAQRSAAPKRRSRPAKAKKAKDSPNKTKVKAARKPR
jgi:DNA transformation protein